MRSNRRLTFGAMAIAVALTIPASAAHAAAQTAPFNAFTIDGAGNSDLLPAGTSLAFAGDNVTGSTDAGGVFTLHASAGGEVWSAAVAAETGGALAVGVTYPTQLTADATHVGLALVANGTECTASVSGTLTVEEITLDASQNVTALAATYTDSCGSPDVVTGELRFGSSIGYVAAVQDASQLNFGTQDFGQTFPAKTITITSDGSDPITFGTAAIGGTDPDTFAISADTCSGQSVANGATCKISIVANPSATGSAKGTVTIPDNTKMAHRIAALLVTGKVGSAGTYQAIVPARLLDTRFGTGAPTGPVGAGGIVHLQVSGHGGVPASGVSAVVLNVTETGATKNSFLTAYPDGVTRPTASNLNFTAGSTLANSVTVRIGSNGKVDIYNSLGDTQIIADVSGYFVGSDTLAGGGQFQPFVPPTRVLDTRQGGPLPAGSAVILPLDFDSPGNHIDSHVRALAVNITAVGPKASGFLTAWSGSGTRPATSTLNFAAGATVPNMAIVPTSICPASRCGTALPQIGVYNGSAASTHVLVDLVGFFDDGTLPLGMRFHPITPTRITDTRSGLGAPGPLTAGKTDKITTPGSIMDDLTFGLALNVTAVAPTKSTFLSLWPSDQSRPTVSTLNPVAGQTVANAAITLLSFDGLGRFSVFNSAGTTNVVIDVAGTYELYPFPATPGARAPLRRPGLVPRRFAPKPGAPTYRTMR